MLLPNTPPASPLFDVYEFERMFLHLVLAKAMNAISTPHHPVALRQKRAVCLLSVTEE